ncbi:HAD-IIIA family hydrolase [Streptosporangium sp. KLBMP 9127]|nr:HAD-IIIA family hydrolase [Streptosporangium sp. KLBMP 9127]
MSRNRAVFLDRDGTLNEKAPPGEYIRRPEELVLLPGAAEAVRRVNRAGVLAVLVTNQRWLARPPAGPAAYAAVDARLRELLAERGARLDAGYVCPHPLDRCDCRKPAPGMLTRAAADHSISLPGSCMVGDSVSDLLAGRAVGAATVLIHPLGREVAESSADFVARHIGEAVDWALTALQR